MHEVLFQGFHGSNLLAAVMTRKTTVTKRVAERTTTVAKAVAE